MSIKSCLLVNQTGPIPNQVNPNSTCGTRPFFKTSIPLKERDIGDSSSPHLADHVESLGVHSQQVIREPK